MDYRKIAQDIVNNVGGKENIKNVTHCFTRLRFVVKDDSKVKKEVLEKIEGVISVVYAGGQHQVVCGAKVTKIYDEVVEIVGEHLASGEVTGDEPVKGKLFDNILQKITQMFTPLIPAIAAAGLIKGLLTAAKLLMNNYGIDISASDTYNILFSTSQVIFYFMPIFLAMTCAKAMKCNQVIAMVIGGTLCYPAIDALIQNTEVMTTIFGLPVVKGVWQIGESAKVFSYVESVIPIILAVLVMAIVEKYLKKWIPEVLQIILVPGIEIFIMIPLTLVVLGPIGIYVGNVIQFIYGSIMSFSTILGGALIGGLWCVFVIFGAHRALLPIGLNDVAVTGRQNILAFAGAANFAQGGAALGVLLKTKSTELKQVAASSTIAATLVGITEPAIYGCNLRLKKPMIYAVICGAIGGAVMGAGNVYGDAFANNGVLTIFTYAAFGMTQFMFYIAGIVIAFFGAAALTYFLGFEDIVDASTTKKNISINADIKIASPVQGITMNISNVSDEVFSSCALGKGIAINPTVGEIIAPEDCEVSVLYPTKHAIGLKLNNGVEMLIHIGINTVALKGVHFKNFVEQGAKIKKGTKIVSFDIDEIKKEGYDPTVMVVISNSNEFKEVNSIDGIQSTLNTNILMINN
ncbi:beta-glucoside-specific PTS transporter subunit IIABC [Anaerorhabdus sp.]|uniref:beta-glucoside-specific PTS transporter subunit IIABC n=1 Tax=Anaerorhabdus sp. TaxID=1872524 RepID=UPI002FC600F2